MMLATQPAEPRPSEMTRPSAVTVTLTRGLTGAVVCQAVSPVLASIAVTTVLRFSRLLGPGQSTTIRYLPAALSRVRHAQDRGTGQRHLISPVRGSIAVSATGTS